MRFSSDGSLCGGIGDLGNWVLPAGAATPIRLPGVGGGACWFGEKVACQVDPRLVTFAAPDWQTPVVLDGTGASALVADGLSWGATLAAVGAARSTRGSFMGRFFDLGSDAGTAVLAAGGGGQLALAQGSLVWWREDDREVITSAYYPTTVRLKDGYLSYCDSQSKLHVRSKAGEVPIQTVDTIQQAPFAFLANGTLWLAYYAPQYGYVIHSASNSASGYRLTGDVFSPDTFGVTFAYCTNAGETPDSIVKGQVMWGIGMMPLVPIAPPVVTPTFQPSPSWKWWLRSDDATSFTIRTVNNHSRFTDRIAMAFAEGGVDNEVFAWQFASLAVIAQREGLTVCAYWDGRPEAVAWGFWAKYAAIAKEMGVVFLPGCQLYPFKPGGQLEPPAATLSLWASALPKLRRLYGDAFLWLPLYTQGGYWPPAAVSAMLTGGYTLAVMNGCRWLGGFCRPAEIAVTPWLQEASSRLATAVAVGAEPPLPIIIPPVIVVPPVPAPAHRGLEVSLMSEMLFAVGKRQTIQGGSDSGKLCFTRADGFFLSLQDDGPMLGVGIHWEKGQGDQEVFLPCGNSDTVVVSQAHGTPVAVFEPKA